MSVKFYSDLEYRVNAFSHGKLIITKFFDTKEEAIDFFNYCCAGSNDNYFYEIWHNNSLLFTTEA